MSLPVPEIKIPFAAIRDKAIFKGLGKRKASRRFANDAYGIADKECGVTAFQPKFTA